MTDTIVVAGRHTPFQMDLTADLFIRGFNLYGLSWVTMNSAFRTLSLALANNPVTNVEFAATESTPKTTLVAKDNQSSEYAKMRSDVLGTFLRDAPTKDSTIGPALKEMAQKGVAWEITVQDAFTTEQKALITSQGGDPSRIRGFSTIPKGSDLQPGSVVKTVVLDNWADDKVKFGTMLGMR